MRVYDRFTVILEIRRDPPSRTNLLGEPFVAWRGPRVPLRVASDIFFDVLGDFGCLSPSITNVSRTSITLVLLRVASDIFFDVLGDFGCLYRDTCAILVRDTCVKLVRDTRVILGDFGCLYTPHTAWSLVYTPYLFRV